IRELARDEGLTILLATRYLEEADRLASRLAIVDRGRVVAEGTPGALKSELGDGQTNGEVHRALASLAEVRDVVLEGRRLRARADDGPRAVPVVLQALETAGVRVASVTVSRPSLDDVYLRHTGRRFEEADRAEEVKTR